MSDITVAADEVAATILLHDAEVALGTRGGSGASSLGPFGVSYSASVAISGGAIHLVPPNVVRINGCHVNYTLGLTLTIDLNSILPHFCLPRVCIFGFCTPRICLDWPTIPIPIGLSDSATFDADFTLNPHLSGPDWFVDVVIVGIPSLQFGPATAAAIAAVGAAAAVALLAVPLIGPFLSLAVAVITAAIDIADVANLLGTILTPFVSGLTFTVYRHAKIFEVLPAALPLDPVVNVTLDTVTAAVIASDKNELVLTGGLSL